MSKGQRKCWILVLDDYKMTSGAIIYYLEHERSECRVRHIVTGLTEAQEELKNRKYDIIMVNLSQKIGGGLTAVAKLHKKYAKTPILAYSFSHLQAFYAQMAYRQGARGYIDLTQDKEDLIHALCTLKEGGTYCCPGVHSALFNQSYDKDGENIETITALSEHEMDVLVLYGQGRQFGEIAKCLKISLSTARTYRERICRKLNITNRFQLTNYAGEFARIWKQQV